MWISRVGVREMIVAGAVCALSAVAMPKSAAAQSVGGSYQNSCRNTSMGRNGVLTAECRTNLGTWRGTSIQASDCHGDISNNDGRLTCVAKNDDHAGHGNGNGHGGPPGNPPGNYDRRGGYGGRGATPSITVYTGKRWTGKSMVIGGDYSNLGNTGFNDVISSVRITGSGTWRFCSDKNYGGRCVNITSNTSDLGGVGLLRNISSIRRVN